MPSKEKITADDILHLLSNRYGDTRQYVCAAEVGCATGWANRHVDFMAIHCFESEKFLIEAFEIKISKADLKRELEDPSKHNVFFDDIDTFWIVAPEGVLDNLDILPAKWGVMKVYRSSDGEIALRVARKPVALNDDKDHWRKLSRSFAASMCRAINAQSLTKKQLLAESREIENEVRKRLEHTMANGGHIMTDWEYQSMIGCKRMCERLGISHWWSSIDDYNVKRFREALKVADGLSVLKSKLSAARHEMLNIQHMVDDALSDNDKGNKENGKSGEKEDNVPWVEM